MSRIRGFFSSFANPPAPAACAVTPDEIIADRIIDDFARNFEDWRPSYLDYWPKGPDRHLKSLAEGDLSCIPVISNKKKNIVFKAVVGSVKLKHRDYNAYYRVKYEQGWTVNGVPIALKEAERIIKNWEKLSNQVAETKRVAAAALKRQQENDAKWNLVEKVFGITRDGFGRIVFKQYEEREDDEEEIQSRNSDTDVAGDTVVANDESPLLQPVTGNRRGKPAGSKATTK